MEHGAFAEHGSRSAGAALLQVGKAAGAKTTLQVQPPLTGDDDPGWADELVTEHGRGHGRSRGSSPRSARRASSARAVELSRSSPRGRVI